MLKPIIATICIQLIGTSAMACSAFAQGLPAAELGSHLEQLAESVKRENKDAIAQINSVKWQTVQTTVGIEGDCGAIQIDARVNIEGRSAEGEHCMMPVELTSVQSSQEFLNLYEQKTEGAFCF